jgi:hypothetical protein
MKIYWVATYGKYGLDVVHYTSEAKFKRAVKEAEADHNRGVHDSYVNGDVTVEATLKVTP